MILHKKGVSPLIATVMLIGFTIAMAGIVSTFIIKQTKETLNVENLVDDSSLCDQMSLGVYVPNETKLKLEKDLTKSDSKIYYLKGVSIQNKGSYGIRGLVIFPEDLNSEIQYNFDSRIGKISEGGKKVLPSGCTDGTSTTLCTIKQGAYYNFTDQGIPVTIQVPTTAEVVIKSKIKIYPVIFDPEKEKGVKCVKSVLVFDYKEVCKGYEHTTDDCKKSSA